MAQNEEMKRKLIKAMTRETVTDLVAVDEVLVALGDHALGKRPMAPSMVSAAKTILDKTVPSLQSTEVRIEVDIAERLRRGRERNARVEDQPVDVEAKEVSDGEEPENEATEITAKAAVDD